MRSFYAFVKSTLIGGFLFLLPIGVLLIVMAKLVVYARRAGEVIHARLFPGAEGNFGPTLFAVLFLLLLAFAAGALARTRLGVALFDKLEAGILARLPVYTVIRQAVADLSGGTVRLAAGQGTEVVEVRLDDMTVLGFLIERRESGDAVVFLPGAPSALSGSVALVTGDRIAPTDLSPMEVMAGMRRLGAGLAGLKR